MEQICLRRWQFCWDMNDKEEGAKWSLETWTLQANKETSDTVKFLGEEW